MKPVKTSYLQQDFIDQTCSNLDKSLCFNKKGRNFISKFKNKFRLFWSKPASGIRIISIFGIRFQRTHPSVIFFYCTSDIKYTWKKKTLTCSLQQTGCRCGSCHSLKSWIFLKYCSGLKYSYHKVALVHVCLWSKYHFLRVLVLRIWGNKDNMYPLALL